MHILLTTLLCMTVNIVSDMLLYGYYFCLLDRGEVEELNILTVFNAGQRRSSILVIHINKVKSL